MFYLNTSFTVFNNVTAETLINKNEVKSLKYCVPKKLTRSEDESEKISVSSPVNNHGACGYK